LRYWWVNQNQTYSQEVSGGYMWSPKRNVNGGRNPFYDAMREVSPGDLIVSFKNTEIPAIGVAQSYCYECPKPIEFGGVGLNWNFIGWKVDVSYTALSNIIRPRDYIDKISPLLPSRYSPLQKTGRGNQGVYLTELDDKLAYMVFNLIGQEATPFLNRNTVAETRSIYSSDAKDFIDWESQLTKQVESDEQITETERQSLINARIGQGRFKENVRRIETECRITKVDRLEHLRASHLKPWRDSDNTERLDGENGLLLTPSIDHLFDRGFISFENNGELLISPVADKGSLNKMGVPVDSILNVGGFTDGQKTFLDFHRESIFLEKRLK
jgi:hypothetical protein